MRGNVKHKLRHLSGAVALFLALVFLAGAFHNYIHVHEKLENPCLLMQALSQSFCAPAGDLPVVVTVVAFLPVLAIRSWIPEPFAVVSGARGPPCQAVQSNISVA